MPSPSVALATLAIFAASVVPATAASPFAGRWEGPWQSNQGLAGRFALTIDATGAITGTTTYADKHGSVAGHIDDAGNLTAHYKYDVISYQMKGHFTLSGDHLRGMGHYALPLGVPFDSGPVDLTRR